ncbi:hypothetical protein CTEN210_17295 [Chaetoceros tenuissimus]|uniref:Fe2OG dioxygenase domain-containing protein n=1 Tax=Chaetoceros tenuissimus TaxID=426638 RepID=A0AAD3DAF8_9STRA|nr:hypothetical protein CTEN210_17295 [Chaetoceros tenuissimus]
MAKKKSKLKSTGGKNEASSDPKASKKQSSSSSFPKTLLQDSSNKVKDNGEYDYSQYYKVPKLKVETLVPSAVFVARNLLTQKECQEWVKYSEQQIGYEKLNRPQTREYAQRECGRISQNDWDMADLLYQRMKPMVDEIITQIVVPHANPNYQPITCNGNLRLYRYEKNMSFGKHYDGSERIDRFPNGNTEITVLVYLSSCKGGATRFYLPSSSSKKQNKNEIDKNGIAFQPEAGAILMHMHGDRCLEHEADAVADGVKYVLRTDIVYGCP